MFPATLSLSLLLAIQAEAPEIRSTAADRTELGITLYHAGYAMVRERRKVDLPAGRVRLALEDVADRIEPKTVHFRVLDGPPAAVLERNFEFDLLSPDSLVKHSLGAKVWIPNPLAGAPPIEGVLASLPTPDIYAPPRTPLEAKLDPLTPKERMARTVRGRLVQRRLVERDPGAVVRLPDGFQSVAPGALSYALRPKDLRSVPTLLMDLEASGRGSRILDLAYLSRGLGWHATYMATLHPAGDSLDLDAFITLSNHTRSAFPRVSLQLLAGDPNRVQDPDPESVDPDAEKEVFVEVVASLSAEPFKTEGLGDNHLFTLGRATSLAAGQTKQIALFSARKVPVTRKNVIGVLLSNRVESDSNLLDSGGAQKDPRAEWAPFDTHRCQFRFLNRRSDGLGRPLPQGLLHVNYQDPSGNRIPLFEEIFEATAEGEEAEISLPPLRGLSGQWRLAEITRGGWFRRDTRQVTLEARVDNDRARMEPLEVQVLVGSGWDLLRSNHKGIKERSDLVSFRIIAHPGETMLRATFLVPDSAP